MALQGGDKQAGSGKRVACGRVTADGRVVVDERVATSRQVAANKRVVRMRLGTAFMAVGAALVLAGVSLFCFNMLDSLRAQRESSQLFEQVSAYIEASDSSFAGVYEKNPSMEMPTLEIDGYEYIGTLHIEALGLDMPVMSSWDYARLRIAPCRYFGSAYQGNLVIAAHNYAGQFGNLGKLRPGDAVQFTDVDGNVFVYKVVDLLQLAPTNVEEMTSGNYDLTLFTCNLSGAQRVTVRCQLQATDE